jgi:hypothetical protein
MGKKVLASPLGTKIRGGVARGKAYVKGKIEAVKAKGRAVVDKTKAKLYGGDPDERLRLGISSAVTAVNKYAGRKVTRVVLDPSLAAIRLRRGLTTLKAVPAGRFWAIEGTVSRQQAPTLAETAEDGSQTPGDPAKPGHAQDASGRIIVGMTGPYSAIGAGKVQDPRRTTHPKLMLEAEHIIRREFQHILLTSAGLPGVPGGGSEYGSQTTILIYDGAADAKTHRFEVDARSSVERKAAALRTTASGSELESGLADVLRDWAFAAYKETVKLVKAEEAQNGDTRGSAPPARPSDSEIQAAYETQLRQALGLLSTQADIAAGRRDTGPAGHAQELISATGHLTRDVNLSRFDGPVATITYQLSKNLPASSTARTRKVTVTFRHGATGDVVWQVRSSRGDLHNGSAGPASAAQIATLLDQIQDSLA